MVARGRPRTDRGAERDRGGARRCRLRPVRLLRLRYCNPDLRPARRRWSALFELPHHSPVLPHPRGAVERPQSPQQLDGENHRVGLGISRLQLPHPARERLPVGDPARCRLRDLRTGQVASRPGDPDRCGQPEGQVAARAWLRTVLRIPRRRNRSVRSRPGARQLPRPAATNARGGLPPHRGHHRRGHRLPRRPARFDAAAAVLHVVRPRRLPRTPSGAGLLHRRLPGALRSGVGSVARTGFRTATRERVGARGNPVVVAAGLGAGVGLVERRRTAPRRTNDGGIRRISHPHRRPGRSATRLCRTSGRGRQHHRDRVVGQRCVRRGRGGRFVQRAVLLQLRPRAPQREPAPYRRTRRTEGQQPLPVGVGVGRKHTAQTLQARHPRGRRHRPPHHLVARCHRVAGHDAAPLRACHRPDADPAGAHRHRVPTIDRRGPTERDRRDELR